MALATIDTTKSHLRAALIAEYGDHHAETVEYIDTLIAQIEQHRGDWIGHDDYLDAHITARRG